MVNFFLGAMVGMIGGIFVMTLLVMAKRGVRRDDLYEAVIVAGVGVFDDWESPEDDDWDEVNYGEEDAWEVDEETWEQKREREAWKGGWHV